MVGLLLFIGGLYGYFKKDSKNLYKNIFKSATFLGLIIAIVGIIVSFGILSTEFSNALSQYGQYISTFGIMLILLILYVIIVIEFIVGVLIGNLLKQELKKHT
jgi:uncharacterized membrane protein YesL